ncbi:glycosyltransferase family 2 protein [Candidatus Shapirobacteria bacterium]|nr:glycosyltransferase family 2 protein [Candidatus Shapirobacteria bacterium]
MSTPKFTIIIVNYNSSSYTGQLINSIHKFIPSFVEEIIIVDNNSRKLEKKTIQPFKNKSKVILNSENVGFSRAVNQGIRQSKSSFLLLLNPDCELIDDSIIKLINLINKNVNIGACGGCLIDPTTNKTVPSANREATFLTGLCEFTNLKKIFPNNQFTNDFWIEKSQNIVKKTNVSSLCGAFVLFRKYINGHRVSFDNNYFMYLEDMQFGVDINKAGFKVVFDPDVKIIHHGGKSNDSKYKTILKYWYSSRKIYFKKNLSFLQGRFLEVIFTIEEYLLKKYHEILNTPNE